MTGVLRDWNGLNLGSETICSLDGPKTPCCDCSARFVRSCLAIRRLGIRAMGWYSIFQSRHCNIDCVFWTSRHRDGVDAAMRRSASGPGIRTQGTNGLWSRDGAIASKVFQETPQPHWMCGGLTLTER